jgi:dipeptidyl aminopeptidase/acylaminoacyl peptidase
MSRMVTAVAVLAFTAAAVRAAETPHPFNAVDMQSMVRVIEQHPSPQGDRVAYVLRTSDIAANRAHIDIWLVSADGAHETKITSDGLSSDPQWSPDGRTLYYLTAASGRSELWRMHLNKANPPWTAERVLALPLSISNPMISPDGTHVLFSLEVFPDCATLACTQQFLAQRAANPVKARLYPDGVGFVRHWDAWFDGLRNHLFIARLDAPAGSEPADLTKGMNADVPSKPFGSSEEFTFSPDGKTVVFAARQGGREETRSTNFDLYSVLADGSQPPRNLTSANPAEDTLPRFSPDGRTLVYAAMRRPGFESDRLHIMARDLASGSERELAAAWDHSAGPLSFTPDGRTLLTIATDTGQTLPFAIDLATGKVRKLVNEGHAEALAVAGGRVFFTDDTLRTPADIFSVGVDGADLHQITHVNAAALARIQFGEPEQFHFTGAGGDTVYGWAIKPVGWKPGQRYPVAFLIHGGPQGSFDNHFHYRWNPEVYAGAGYAVIEIDFHGSTGYGQAFTDSISGDWGGKPLIDLQMGLAAAVSRFDWLDGDRVCALGASYGGFMTNWIAGNWPDRFRCLVTHDGVFDQRAMYYSTEELWFEEWENGGTYYEHPENYEKFNPAAFVDRWRTPMLVIQGGLDYRIPETQGLGAFTALQRRGIPSEFLDYPNENHFVLRPNDSVVWHETVLDWLGHWLRDEPLRSPQALHLQPTSP